MNRPLSFDEISRLKQAAKNADYNIKLVVDAGVWFLFPDGWRIKADSYFNVRVPNITLWLNALWTIRREKLYNG